MTKSPDFASRKHIGFVELPDDALGLFGHYAQRPNWEVAIVVGVDPQSYGVRMAQILNVPVLETPNRPALVHCDRLIVGDKPGLLAWVNDLIDDTEIEVIPLADAIRELNSDRPAVKPRPTAAPARVQVKKPVPAAPVEAGPSEPASPPDPPVPEPIDAPDPASDGKPGFDPPSKPQPDYTSHDAFDAGTLLGVDFREKLGALPIDANGDQLLGEILQMAVRVTHAHSGSIMLVDETGTHLKIAVATGLPPWVIEHTRQEVGQGIAGRVFSTGLPRIVRGPLPAHQGKSLEVRPGLREAACVAIPARGGPIGVLNVNMESETSVLDDNSLSLLALFAREASGAILKALDLKRLTGTVQREAVLRQVERLMSLQEDLPARLRSVGEVLGQALDADPTHAFRVDAGQELKLMTSSQGSSVARSGSQPMERGFLGWVLRHASPHVMEATDATGNQRVAMGYLPIVSARPYGIFVLECIPLEDTSSVEVLKFLTEAKEIVEAALVLEETLSLPEDDFPALPSRSRTA